MASTEQVISTLNSLVETSRDGQEGFKTAAEGVRNEELKKLFYLICGVLASLAHVFTTVAFARDAADVLVPSLGASGAISGVLGGYILLYPRNRVHVIIFRIFTTVPAYVALGLWFLFQFVSGIMDAGGTQGGGVAYAAHIGGFLAGLVLVKVFAFGRPVETAPTARARWGGGAGY